jgi:hypothetical protein
MIEGNFSANDYFLIIILLRYIWSGDHYLTVTGRGACTSFPDMPSVNCRSQPKLSNIEHCPEKCPNGCRNGYCDCATGECLCNPGFSGSNCNIDSCAAAGCVNGNCAAKYLGQDLFVTKKPCVCMDGWYGDRCDTTTPPPVSDPEPTCFEGSYFFADTEIGGGHAGLVQTSDAKACNAACNANADCKGWIISVICFLKTGTERIYKPGMIAGIKCSAGIGSSTTAPSTMAPSTMAPGTMAPVTTAPTTNYCDGKCKGQYPYGCNGGFEYGYCNEGGGCAYSITSHPNWCCFKGCDQPPSSTIPPVTTTVPTAAPTPVTEAPVSTSCDSKCRGQFPYGCNHSFPTGYCNSGGGCSYSTMNDPDWCCFKGC